MRIPICEIFQSFQGEGIHTGIAMVFVRTAGCNLDCSWCDTGYARNAENAREMRPEEILEEVGSHRSRWICLTGGEPLIHRSTIDLVRMLADGGYNVDVETNGTVPVRSLLEEYPGVFLSVDVKTPSSGEKGSFLDENLGHLRQSDQLKFIVADGEDVDFALDFIKRHNPPCNIIFTPCSNKGGEDIAKYLMGRLEDGVGDVEMTGLLKRTRLMVQTHKVIWHSNRRGV